MTSSRTLDELVIIDPRGAVSTWPDAAADRAPVRWREHLRDGRVGFLSNGKPNVRDFMEAVARQLAESGARAGCMLTKPGPLETAPAELIETLAQQSDIVLTGICDGGTASSWGVRDALRLVALGVPTVLICTTAFRPLVLSVLPPNAAGVILLEIPHPFSSITAAEVQHAASEAARSLEGRVGEAARRARLQPDGAAQPEEPAGQGATLSMDAHASADDALYALQLTDGLPTGVPTVQRVQAALSRWPTRHGASPALAIPPRGGLATPQALAANAILAGLPAHLLPYLVASVNAACAPAFNLFGLQTTTNPVTPAVVVGGPAHEAAGFHHGLGALGPGHRANATLGRALRLCMQNLGGARATDGSDPATMGQPGKYTLCFAAAEDGWPWPTLREQTRGTELERTDDAVTLVAVTGSVNLIIKSRTATELLDTIADSIRIVGSNDYMFGGHPLLVLCPEHAAILRNEGLPLGDIQAHLLARSTIAFSRFPPKNREMMLAPRAHEFERLEDDTPVPIAARASDILVCVAGGPSMHSTFFPSFGGSLPSSAKVHGQAAPGAMEN